MFDYSKVDTVIERIIDAAHPKMIIVFGSVASRTAKDDSDLDILVVFDKMESQREAYILVKKQFRNLRLPSDVFVMDLSEFNHWKDDRFSFTYEIVKTGTVVYDS